MTLGLTGSIGSGKSTVAKVFEVLGAAIFNSDQIAKSAYFDAHIRPQVIQLLGKESYESPNEINKQYIADKVFNHPDLLKHLNAIIHPFVKSQMKNFEQGHAGKIIIKETALLFEAGLEQDVDAVIVVTAPEQLRIERTMKRDGVSKEQVLKRMQAQLSQEEKLKRAQYIVINDEQHLVIPQVLALLNQFQS